MGALVWITLGSATPLSSLTVRPSALTIPSVTLDCSPSGLPIARATSPTWRWEESAKAARVQPGGADVQHRQVVGREAAHQPAAVRPAVGQGDLEAVGVVDHVVVGDHVALGVEDDAGAEPFAGADEDHGGADLLDDLDELLLQRQRRGGDVQAGGGRLRRAGGGGGTAARQDQRRHQGEQGNQRPPWRAAEAVREHLGSFPRCPTGSRLRGWSRDGRVSSGPAPVCGTC
jgi:hypothetical protein